MQTRDRGAIERLPDEFAMSQFPPEQTIRVLVEKYWGEYEWHAKLELQQVLLAELEAGAVTEEVRRRCRNVLKEWVRRQ